MLVTSKPTPDEILAAFPHEPLNDMAVNILSAVVRNGPILLEDLRHEIVGGQILTTHGSSLSHKEYTKYFNSCSREEFAAPIRFLLWRRILSLDEKGRLCLLIPWEERLQSAATG